MIFYFVNLVLQFYSRKIFLEYLGTEILGLNTTAANLLQFLNLAELGISSAVGFTLYRPLKDKDINTINEIVHLQGHLYRRIALIIIVAGIALMAFFPLIFAKIHLPLWYAYAVFTVFLTSALLGYFVNYKQIILSANQEEYKIRLSYNSIILLKILVQIVVVSHIDNPYVWWMVVELAGAVAASFSLSLMTRRSAPYLKKTSLSYSALKEKYHELTIKIRQLFVHKLSYFAAGQITPLVIYGYMTLTDVTRYENYMILVWGGLSLTNAVFNGLMASVGNLVVSESADKIYSVFKELFSVRFWFASCLCFAIFFFGTPLVRLWIGPSFELPSSSLLLIDLILFIQITRNNADSFLFAYQLVRDIWAPLVEFGINISLSLWLGYYYGLDGILTGFLISLIIIPLLWKAYYTFHAGFKRSYKGYLVILIKHAVITFVVFYVSSIILSHTNLLNISDIGDLILKGSFTTFAFSIILAGFLIYSRCGLEIFLRRMKNIILK